MSILNENITALKLAELLKDGADIHQLTRKGQNALHIALFGVGQWDEKMRLLVDAGIDVNLQDSLKFKNTPLQLLIANESHDDALCFINYAGAKINYSIQDTGGKTPLILAAKVNATAVAAAILRHCQDTDLNIQDDKGMTALHYACLYGNSELFHLLVTRGASLSILNKDGKLPVDCVLLGKKAIKETLESIEIDPERDEKAEKNSFEDLNGKWLTPMPGSGHHYHFIDALIGRNDLRYRKCNLPALKSKLNEALVDTWVFGQTGLTVEMGLREKNILISKAEQMTGRSLIDALTESAQYLKRELINLGYYSDYLLRGTAAIGDIDSVRSLIANAPHCINNAGALTARTALHQAVINNRGAVCSLLIEQGANLNVQDIDGNTPLHLALQKRNISLAIDLIARGAHLGTKNKNGKNALALLRDLGLNHLKADMIAAHRHYLTESCPREEKADHSRLPLCA